MRMNVLLCGQLDADEEAAWRASLGDAAPEFCWLTREQAHAHPADVDAAVVANPPPGSLQGLPRLRLIQSLWAGVDRLLQDSTLPPNVPIARMVDPAMNDAMAQTALWAVLSLHRGFFTYAAQQRQGLWQPLPQRRADEVSVAVLGLGQMGGTVARRLHEQGYRVTGWASHGPARSAPFEQRFGLPALPELLGRSEVVVNLLPLTPATRGLVQASFLAQLPRGSSLVNLARGAHVVEADLLAALDTGHLAHAVLDVFHTEPLPAAHRFWQHPCITVLPHAAAGTDERSAAAVVVANLRALAAGRPLAHVVERSRGY
jgi:glyoxylate/hydroxypyruvate reductase